LKRDGWGRKWERGQRIRMGNLNDVVYTAITKLRGTGVGKVEIKNVSELEIRYLNSTVTCDGKNYSATPISGKINMEENHIGNYMTCRYTVVVKEIDGGNI